MPHEEILTVLTESLGRVAGADPVDITPSTRFADDLNVDSLTLVSLVVDLEDRFGTVLSDDTWARVVTVGDAVAELERATQLAH